MLKSMTGYGRAEAVVGKKKITAEIKSVNHRFSDYNIKVPRQYGYLEERLRRFLSERISRGKVDVYIGIEACGEADKIITVNKELAGNYISAFCELRDGFGLADDITVSKIAAMPDVFRSEPVREDEEQLWADVRSVAAQALDEFIAMREREGGRIESDLRARVGYMKTLVAKIEARSPQTVNEYRDKLKAKLEELLGEHGYDEARVLTEAAIFADKIAVNEETVRLGSHFEEFEEMISGAEPAGRRLDFLIQEMNREVNTIGSKCSDLDISKVVVTLKGEIEKLREQIQNIE